MVDHVAALDHLIDGGWPVAGPDHLDVRHRGMMAHGEVDVLQRVEGLRAWLVSERLEEAERLLRRRHRQSEMMKPQSIPVHPTLPLEHAEVNGCRTRVHRATDRGHLNRAWVGI